jgi:hypothetical protein
MVYAYRFHRSPGTKLVMIMLESAEEIISNHSTALIVVPQVVKGHLSDF